ncbi:succinate dehydrogenase, hydrophobic membrane anchor protein [Nitrosococcus halophilus Nc 4]|uniref:Succinate dehydrogenase hydrophobic membrane anchor subunit n=1 Tax=Nitrosococcus halophilus (strain Nc4) TaxID=472759 RepID=D5BX06_NITHN|nr:succinate dehydrogenase, hydrophobic membrane anchor protein [Nitrosococcus halophilus]ADE13887.1 succinate dehydrogenase, hydrophobic membrane anchor protein [Nitrosococcus halophilus Nc 4]
MKGVMTGLRAWLVQRVTAVFMLVVLLLFFIRLVQDPFESYEEWQRWVGEPLISVLVTLFFGALLLHAWVGLRDVILDYVHSTPLRLFAHSLVVIGYSGIAFWIVRILLR